MQYFLPVFSLLHKIFLYVGLDVYEPIVRPLNQRLLPTFVTAKCTMHQNSPTLMSAISGHVLDLFHLPESTSEVGAGRGLWHLYSRMGNRSLKRSERSRYRNIHVFDDGSTF